MVWLKAPEAADRSTRPVVGCWGLPVRCREMIERKKCTGRRSVETTQRQTETTEAAENKRAREKGTSQAESIEKKRQVKQEQVN